MSNMQETFLESILPEQGLGYYFALALRKPNDRVQRAMISKREIADFCNGYSAAGYDTYMALASFAEVSYGRKATNALGHKCFWMDIDVGKTTTQSYDSFEEALEALVVFSEQTGLTPTFVVRSGVGIHAYWAMTKMLPRDLWMEASGYFSALHQQYGLKVDKSCVGDSARVLRMPGTLHVSSGQQVEILFDNSAKLYTARNFVEQIVTKLSPGSITSHTVQHSVAQPVLPPIYTSKAVMQATGMIQPPTAYAEPIVRNCPAMMTMGMQSYHQWFLGMSVLKRCVDGREWAHKLSALDPRYVPSDTDKKFDDAGDDSPARCDAFRTVCPGMCTQCAYSACVSSPVQLYRIVPHTQKNEAPQPAGGLVGVLGGGAKLALPDSWSFQRVPITHPDYIVDGRGIVKRIVTKDPHTGGYATQEVVLCASQLYYLYSETRVVDDRPQRSYMFEAVHPGGKSEHVRYIIEQDSGPQQTLRWFSNANMYSLYGSGGKELMAFMNAYLASVVHGAPDLPTVDRFGWQKFRNSDGQTETGFVVGSGIITESGVKPVRHGAMAAPHAAKEFAHAGTLEKWKYIPQMYKTLGQEIGQLTICMAFAAPLMKYGSGEAKNAVLSIWSPNSGQGKSQLLAACATIWGDPQHAFFSRQESVVARMRRLALWNNIPALMDELTDLKDEDMYSLAYTLAGGKEKNKLKSSGDAFVQTGDWSTCTISSANRSFKEAIVKYAGDSEATLLRIMEYECEFPSYADVPQVQDYINMCAKLCKENYGLAGPEFVYHLLQHPDRMETLTRMAEIWCDKHKLQTRERFMGYPLALALIAGRWAVEWGLLDYDMDMLERWVLDVFIPHNRRFTSEYAPDVRELLASYISEQSSHTLIVHSEDRPANMRDPASDIVPDKYVIAKPTGDVRMRYAFDDHELRIVARDLKRWCRFNRVSMVSMVKRLDAAGLKMKRSKVSLTKDIRYMASAVQDGFVLESDVLCKLGFGFDAFANTDQVKAASGNAMGNQTT